MSRPTILLNPGPVTLTDRVRKALLSEDICHREADFAALMLDIKFRLAEVYSGAGDRFDPILLAGSGTCAVEAMLSSLAPKRGKTLVLANGVYGERMAAMLQAQGKPFVVVQSPWLQPIDLDRTEELLAAGSEISHVAAVHNETTTGRLNDLAALGALCARHGKALLLDAVSSFGGESIDFEGWNLQAAASTAGKCLHGVPGMAFVMVDRSVLRGGSSRSDTLYLDLFRYHGEQHSGSSPYTPSVHAAFALQEALRELSDGGGWRARNRRYAELSGAIRRGLADLGVDVLLDEESCSSMISSFRLPSGWTYGALHDALREAGFVIYAGQGDLAQSIFRLCNMGDVRDEDIERLLETFGRLLAN
jgi:2-aminoethylphosphonate-pyruvate transaminase